MSDPALEVMRHWQSGAATGDWSGLLAWLDPDVAFHVPVAGFSGHQRGLEAAARFFGHLTAVLRAELVITSTLRGADRTGFEVAVTGTMHGQPFVQALCLFFELADGRVLAFREYLAWPGGLPMDTAR
jgi:ketosteroid isomerase-like protein